MVVLEYGVEAHHRHLGLGEERTHLPHLRDGLRHAAWAEHLEGCGHDDAATQAGQIERPVGVEPLGDVPLGGEGERPRHPSPSPTRQWPLAAATVWKWTATTWLAAISCAVSCA